MKPAIAISLILFVASALADTIVTKTIISPSPTPTGVSPMFVRYAEAEVTNWIVKLKEDKGNPSKNKDRADRYASVVTSYGGSSRELKHVKLHILHLKQNARRAARFLRDNDVVDFVSPDMVVSIAATPSDPMYSQMWDMTNVQADLGWDVTTGSSNVVVAIIDTGIWFDHPDLAANIWTDPTTGGHGWTCMGGNLVVGGEDDFGHGTHVAGTIGAVPNNGIGIAGENWQVSLASFKFLNMYGSGSLSDAIILIDKIIDLKLAGVNIRLTSNSWGGAGSDPGLQAAFQALEDNNILSVCAAGNNGVEMGGATLFIPGCFTNRGIITVTASTQNGSLASFSNYGLGVADIAAPGVSILSTLPTNSSCLLNSSTGYGYLNGTSMATPHVTGLAALVLALNPNLSVYELRDVILDPNSYDPLSGLASLSTTGGRMNVYKTLTNPLVYHPRTNTYPSITSVQYGSTVQGGVPQTFVASAVDADGDVLRYRFVSDDLLFSSANSNTVTFTPKATAIDYVATYELLVADGRGGSTVRTFQQNVLKPTNFVAAPFGVSVALYNVTPTNVQPAVCYSPGSDTNIFAPWILGMAEIGSCWDVIVTDQSLRFAPLQIDCGSPLITFGYLIATPPPDNVFGFFGDTWDSQLVYKQSPYQYIRTGVETNANRLSPSTVLTLTNNAGYAPLAVGYDLSQSVLPNGPITNVTVYGYRTAFYHQPVTGTLTLREPGTYGLTFIVQDASNFWAANKGFATVYVLGTNVPPPGPTNPPPPPPPPLTNTVPLFTSQPVGAVVVAGSQFTLAASATGTPTPTYQWFREGLAVGLATNRSLTLVGSGATMGNYYVTATNAAGSARSATVLFGVLNAPSGLGVASSGGVLHLSWANTSLGQLANVLKIYKKVRSQQTLIQTVTLASNSIAYDYAPPVRNVMYVFTVQSAYGGLTSPVASVSINYKR